MDRPLEWTPGTAQLGRVEITKGKFAETQNAFGGLLEKNRKLEIKVLELESENERLRSDLRDVCSAFETIKEISERNNRL